MEIEDPLPAITPSNKPNLRVGDIVFAIGNPLNADYRDARDYIGYWAHLVQHSGTELTKILETDARLIWGILRALVDAMGRLIGINTAIVSRLEVVRLICYSNRSRAECCDEVD